MTQFERGCFLIRYLTEEMPEYRDIPLPEDETQQWQILRSLMNIRPPHPISRAFLDVQDAYLSEMISRRRVLDCRRLPPTRTDSRIFLWQGDITRLKADAIVNAANSALLGCFSPCHSCIDNIIHSLSGVQLRLKCNEIMQAQGHEEPAGGAKITPAYNLPCRYVIHTVGPVISGPLKKRDCNLLSECYESCLKLATANELESIAFCCISTGVFRFPQEKAAEIATDTVRRFLEHNTSIRQVIFNVFTDRDLKIYQNILL